MTTDPLADAVSRQYERWVYPEPIEDLPGWLIRPAPATRPAVAAAPLPEVALNFGAAR